jgi:hypothetical protein
MHVSIHISLYEAPFDYVLSFEGGSHLSSGLGLPEEEAEA